MSANACDNERILAVLAYHKIGAPTYGSAPSWFYVTESIFVEQLSWLRNRGWQVVSGEDCLHGLLAPDSLPERTALITFDDGCQSVLSQALPILQSFGFPSVLFVPTDFVGSKNCFDAGVEPEEPICSWAELLKLQRSGVSIQSHSVTHRRFSGLDESALRDELCRSKSALQARLGSTVRMFSFPYGDEGPDRALTSRLLLEAGYDAAFLYGSGIARPHTSNRYCLPRVAIGADTDLEQVLGNV